MLLAPRVSITGARSGKPARVWTVGDTVKLPQLGQFTVAGLVTHTSKTSTRSTRTCDAVLVQEVRGKLGVRGDLRWRAERASHLPSLPGKTSRGKYVNNVYFK